LLGEKILRRFLLHVPPEGFMRIRHYGYLANRVCVKQLEHRLLRHPQQEMASLIHADILILKSLSWVSH